MRITPYYNGLQFQIMSKFSSSTIIRLENEFVTFGVSLKPRHSDNLFWGNLILETDKMGMYVTTEIFQFNEN